jgi:hypothetical protein
MIDASMQCFRCKLLFTASTHDKARALIKTHLEGCKVKKPPVVRPKLFVGCRRLFRLTLDAAPVTEMFETSEEAATYAVATEAMSFTVIRVVEVTGSWKDERLEFSYWRAAPGAALVFLQGAIKPEKK